MTDFKFIIGIIAGLVIGIAVENFLDKPCPEIKTANTKTVTTETTRTQGIPDTTVKVKSQNSKIKIKNTGTTEFKLKDNESGIKSVAIVQSDNDSSEVEVEYQYPETTIKQTDQVSTETTIKDSTSRLAGSEEQSNAEGWQIAIGSLQMWNNEIEVNKYFEISYQKKIWFFYIKGSAGINNKLNDAFNNLKIHTKAELNIPLN